VKYLDKEVMEILKSMQGDMKSMQGDMKSMQSDMKSMRSDISRIDGKLENVENKTDKNTLLLEDLNRKVQTIAEVDSSLAEQLDREKHKDNKSSDDRLNIIELAVTDTSSRVKDIQKDLSRVVRATGENWAEIVELKAVR
jgi:chromosome segregation ATPase